MSLDSTVGIAKIGTRSLRATVPEGIVAYLGIQAGDKLDWTMENDRNGERIVIVRKAKPLGENAMRLIAKHAPRRK
jgi:bifunctional DNA-binding transcriptional regulator/antitoxin component of YhaV-PrlF toxin-antitoxin module